MRGIENVMATVLLIVIAIIAALTIYLIVSHTISSASSPDVQIDPYQSALMGGGKFILAVKFGAPYPAITKIIVYNSTGTQVCETTNIRATGQQGWNNLDDISSGSGSVYMYPNNQPAQGQEYYIYGICSKLAPGMTYKVQIYFQTGNPVMLTWQT
ncbi:MAG: hypothetical protein QXU93_08005 [Thermoproteus sp.]